MSNCGSCSIIVKEKDSVKELIDILNKNYDEESGRNFLTFTFNLEGHDWKYHVTSAVTIENTDNYVRFETEYRHFDAVCTYLKLKGIDFIFLFDDEEHGMGGLTNDTTGEFFKPCLYVLLGNDDTIEVDLPFDANADYINEKVKEIEKQYNEEAMHWYAFEYCPDSYFELQEYTRIQCEKQIEEMVNNVN